MARPKVAASDSVDDQVEVAREGLDDVGGPRPRRSSRAAAASRTSAVTRAPLSRASWVAIRPTPPVARVTQDALAEYEPRELERSQRRQAGGGERGGMRVGHAVGDRGQPTGRNRCELCPGTSVDQADDAGAVRVAAAVGGGALDHSAATSQPGPTPRADPAGRGSRRD